MSLLVRILRPGLVSLNDAQRNHIIIMHQLVLVEGNYHSTKKANNHHANLPLEMYSYTL